MKAAVITPYHKEDIAILRRCHLSVLDQEAPCRHFMVADGHPNEIVAGWDCEHIVLSKAHKDTGNTPRAIGGISAMNQGYEVILFLDVDNWYCPDHVSEAISIKHANPTADVVALRRHIVLPDGTAVPDSKEDIENSHVDTSCYAFFETSYCILSLWAMMPPFLGPIGDRIIFTGIKSKQLSMHWSNKKTCYYTSNYKSSYLAINRPLPSRTNDADLSKISRLLAESKQIIRDRTGMNITLS